MVGAGQCLVPVMNLCLGGGGGVEVGKIKPLQRKQIFTGKKIA